MFIKLLLTLGVLVGIFEESLGGPGRRGCDDIRRMHPAPFCTEALEDCAEEAAMKYQPIHERSDISPAVGYARAVGRKGLTEVCRVLRSAEKCFHKNTEDLYCRDGNMRYDLKAVFDFVDLICDEKREDLENNWECLFSSAVMNGVNQCKGYSDAVQECNMNPMEKCIKDVIGSSPGCSSAASEVGAEILVRLILASSRCRATDVVCKKELQDCEIFPIQFGYVLDPMKLYLSSNPTSSVEFCREFVRRKECAITKLEQQQCRQIHSDFNLDVLKGLYLMDYLCVAKKDDLERHYDCLTSPTSREAIKSCWKWGQNYNPCDPNELENCLRRAMSQNSVCSSDAYDLIANLTSKLMSKKYGC